MWGFERCETVSIAESAQCPLVRCLTQLCISLKYKLDALAKFLAPFPGQFEFEMGFRAGRAEAWRQQVSLGSGCPLFAKVIAIF